MPGLTKAKKKPPLRLAELRALRANEGLACPGKLEWDMHNGMLKAVKTDSGSVYSYTCPNCKDAGQTGDYRKRCGRKLM